jgi:hypothetical protein
VHCVARLWCSVVPGDLCGGVSPAAYTIQVWLSDRVNFGELFVHCQNIRSGIVYRATWTGHGARTTIYKEAPACCWCLLGETGAAALHHVGGGGRNCPCLLSKDICISADCRQVVHFEPV